MQRSATIQVLAVRIRAWCQQRWGIDNQIDLMALRSKWVGRCVLGFRTFCKKKLQRLRTLGKGRQVQGVLSNVKSADFFLSFLDINLISLIAAHLVSVRWGLKVQITDSHTWIFQRKWMNSYVGLLSSLSLIFGHYFYQNTYSALLNSIQKKEKIKMTAIVKKQPVLERWQRGRLLRQQGELPRTQCSPPVTQSCTKCIFKLTPHPQPCSVPKFKYKWVIQRDCFVTFFINQSLW